MAENRVMLVGFPELNTFQQRLADAVKGALGSFIPDETIRQVLDSEWKKFTEGTPEVKDRWGNVTPAAEPEFTKFVRDEMRRQVTKKIEAWGEEWGKGPECSDMAREALEKASGVAARAWQETIVRTIVGQVISSLPARDQPCRSCGRLAPPGGQCSFCGIFQ